MVWIEKMQQQTQLAPVITIDGPSGSGKGTISQLLAREMGWHFLDSGAIYRAVAWAVMHYQISIDDSHGLACFINQLNIRMIEGQGNKPAQIFVNDYEVTQEIRQQECGQMASKIGVISEVRKALLSLQRQMRMPPGLIADGRDMGTVIFPDAEVKFFLTASAAERAQRRYNQLKEKGISVTLRSILEELEERDERDRTRAISPTKPADDVILIDTTSLTVKQVFAKVMEYVRKCV